jgi:lysophospholipid acyltransferase (LPLAT)-like uncharacterized protein
MNRKKIWQDFLRFSGQFMLDKMINVLCRSLSITVRNKENIEKLINENKNFIIAFWHSTMLLPWYMHRNMNIAALISKSKDGELLAKLLRKWNYKVIRGSSSSGGDVALGIMVDYARNNQSLAITPDGPRGPARKFKAGAVITAKKSGVPLILLGIGIKRKKILKSWDQFQVPFFFTKINAVYSEPFYIDKEIDYNAASGIINKCDEVLNKLQAEAEKFN